AERFGRQPKWVVAAPGRVNIIGEHIDYNDGFVLPMAIERYCVIAADAKAEGDHIATVFSAATNNQIEVSLVSPTPHEKRGHWSNYFAGVVAGCVERGMRLRGFDAVVESTVPVGGGLSSSASFEVATATLFEAMTGTLLEPAAKALLCQKAEHEFAGVPCGIMDQFASAICQGDHLMLLDCRSQRIEQIPFVDPKITVLIINSNVKHELSGGEYAERRAKCESAAKKLGAKALRDVSPEQLMAAQSTLEEVEFRRARHAVTEITRTLEAAAAIKSGEWGKVGQLMYASHASLRDDFEVSCSELDLLVELAQEIGANGGVIGSRMTGGGFGGCTVSLVETIQATEVTDAIVAGYEKKIGIKPDVITTRPARGAHVVQTKVR
ncbi:MAG TPA: galactokinase, partial [Lacipirellulaceae bacterium]|nr:galactokinase [Lacipirellulaceae bacterium]